MNTFFAYLFLMNPFLGGVSELTIKSDDVKIGFYVDKDHSGTVSGFKATILFDVNDLANSSISGTVDASTLDTENPKRDAHLQSADYLDAAKYPTMGFKSTAIVAEGDGFTMKGLMTIKDVEREESISFGYSDNIFKGTSTISMSYYNIGGYAKKKPEETQVKISFAVPVM